MDDGLPSYGDCPSCGGRGLRHPTLFEEDSWMLFLECGEPVILWSGYKAMALDTASAALANRMRGRRKLRR